MTDLEIKTALSTPLTTFHNGLVIQKVLLPLASTVTNLIAAERLLAILEGTELRALFLALYPEMKLTPANTTNVNSVSSIQVGILPYRKIIIRAINELSDNLPSETLDLLKDYLIKESPVYFIAVSVFTITAMVLVESGEI